MVHPSVLCLVTFFLKVGRVAGAQASWVRAPQMHERQAILAELEAHLGNNSRQVAEARARRLEEKLRPTFASLPRSERGTIDAPAARYALRRLFVQQHGWQLQGLEPAGGQWTEAPPTEVLGSRVPPKLRTLMEGRLDAVGFSLHELAVFASLIEESIHGETEDRLRSICGALGRSEEGVFSYLEATDVIDMYMASYILGANVSSMTPEAMTELRGSIHENHRTWPETVLWLREVQRKVRPATAGLTLADVEAVVEAAADGFGQWQSAECRLLKGQLVEIEETSGSGRVRLSDFYGAAIHDGKWQFSETVGYLRELGAIDDSNPDVPRVIISNYMNSPTNCLASSSFYAVCCLDECEELLGHLENKIGAPSADPDEILGFVRALPSASLAANRTLPAALERRLHEVAAYHGGHVQIHGRLFAQWMHHVYPRECPYPHVSGTTNPQRPEGFEAKAGQEATATEEEMLQHISAGWSVPKAQAPEEEGLCSSMWSMEEELVSPIAQAPALAAAAPAESSPGWRAALQGLAIVAAVASLLATLLSAAGPLRAGSRRKEKSHLPN